MIDTGDTVLHRPTGEQWLVAGVEGDRLSWLGCPEGTASQVDCDLIRKASPEDRMMWLRDLAKPAREGGDHRVRMARKVLMAIGTEEI